MQIKTKQKLLPYKELKELQSGPHQHLEIIGPELIELPLLPSTVVKLKLTTPKLDFSHLNWNGSPLELLKIKGNGQRLKITNLPPTLKIIYLEDVELKLDCNSMSNLVELTFIKCNLEKFPFKKNQLTQIRRLVIDDNHLSEIDKDILESQTLTHFSIENNPLSLEFKTWLEKKFPHRF